MNYKFEIRYKLSKCVNCKTKKSKHLCCPECNNLVCYKCYNGMKFPYCNICYLPFTYREIKCDYYNVLNECIQDYKIDPLVKIRLYLEKIILEYKEYIKSIIDAEIKCYSGKYKMFHLIGSYRSIYYRTRHDSVAAQKKDLYEICSKLINVLDKLTYKSNYIEVDFKEFFKSLELITNDPTKLRNIDIDLGEKYDCKIENTNQKYSEYHKDCKDICKYYIEYYKDNKDKIVCINCKKYAFKYEHYTDILCHHCNAMFDSISMKPITDSCNPLIVEYKVIMHDRGEMIRSWFSYNRDAIAKYRVKKFIEKHPGIKSYLKENTSVAETNIMIGLAKRFKYIT